MEHNKTEIFHFTKARHPPNPSIDLTTVGGPIINPKLIWRYLSFFFDRKLNFHYHTHFYATKCLSTLSAMKMLGNSSRGLLPMQKRLLYRTYILPIAMYGFNLWFFKGTPIVKNINKLKKMQCKTAFWITGIFWTSSSNGIEAIAGLIPITHHMHKLNVSQTSFGHISINSSSILTVSMATESPWKDLSIGTSHISRRSVMAEILGRSTGNHHGTVY